MFRLLLILLLSTSISCQAGKIQSMYDSLVKYHVSYPRISLSIIMLETGWLECRTKPNCPYLQNNNLFGFMWKGKFKKYKTETESIKDYRRWQVKHWYPFKKKYPKKNYYDFLVAVYYCDRMDNYIKQLKIINKKLDKYL